MGMIIEKFFGMLLQVAIKDVTSFTYVLEVLGEGFQSM